MKKLLLLAIVSIFSYSANAQTTVSPLEKLLTDSICGCIMRVDLNKINSKQDPLAAFTNCFATRTDLLMKLADEKHVDPTDNDAMRQIGIDIGKDLLNENCVAFTKLSVKMVQQEDTQKEKNDGAIEGNFKRMYQKGFNYIVLSNANNGETSFLWLQQFPGSESFMGSMTKYIGKKLRIKYQDLEVYLPLAKGYYKVKEITAIEVL